MNANDSALELIADISSCLTKDIDEQIEALLMLSNQKYPASAMREEVIKSFRKTIKHTAENQLHTVRRFFEDWNEKIRDVTIYCIDELQLLFCGSW